MNVFRIFNTKTKEYANKGNTKGWREWSTEGKLWTSKRNLNLHLTGVKTAYQPRDYGDCEIIEYELVEKRRIPFKDWGKK